MLGEPHDPPTLPRTRRATSRFARRAMFLEASSRCDAAAQCSQLYSPPYYHLSLYAPDPDSQVSPPYLKCTHKNPLSFRIAHTRANTLRHIRNSPDPWRGGFLPMESPRMRHLLGRTGPTYISPCWKTNRSHSQNRFDHLSSKASSLQREQTMYHPGSLAAIGGNDIWYQILVGGRT